MPTKINWKVVEELATCTDTHSGYPSVRALVALAARAPCEWQSTVSSPSHPAQDDRMLYPTADNRGQRRCGTCNPDLAATLHKKLGG